MNADQMKEFVELCKHQAIAGKRGEWVGTDHAWWEDTGKPETCYADAPTDQAISGQLAVWLPPVYNYQNPERGLWGMVDWQYVHTADYMTNDGDFWLYDKRGTGEDGEFSGPLPLVLAKAIIWQHERTKP